MAVHYLKVREHERALEKDVSKIIGNMHVMWLAIEDEPSKDSQRRYLEQNTIALLSNHDRQTRIDPSSGCWLGHHCDKETVQTSGLWNSDGVDKRYEPEFLVTMEKLVRKLP